MCPDTTLDAAKRAVLAIAVLSAACLTLPARAQDAPATLPPSITTALKHAGIAPASVGAFVQEVGASRPILSHNAGTPMNPASVMKLVTTYAALELLGPAFSWRTELLGRQNGEVLEGDLYLRGNGDPKLTIENFWMLVRGLRSRGVREIRGDLVLDRNSYEGTEIDPSRFDGDPLKPYNVGPDPLMVNFKSLRLRFAPDGDRGVTLVTPEPRLPQVEIIANVRAVPGGCGDWRAQLKLDVQNAPNRARVVVGGAMPASCGERSYYLGLLSHQQFVYGTFKALWEELGGTIRGGVRDGTVPADARSLALHESPALTEVIRDINKFSNNVMTRQLFLSLSAEITKLPGRTDRSFRAVQSWLREKSVDMPELVMENGSGLSRIERISAESMVRLLLAAYSSAVMPEFVSSMPLVAYDGTMRNRLRTDSIAGQAHVKTGRLAGVLTLAGYVRDRTGRRYAMAFFVNHPHADNAGAAQDAFMRWVYGEASARARPAEASIAPALVREAVETPAN